MLLVSPTLLVRGFFVAFLASTAGLSYRSTRDHPPRVFSYFFLSACWLARLPTLMTVFKTVWGGGSQVVKYRHTVVLDESVGVHFRLLHCQVSFFCVRIYGWVYYLYFRIR